HNNQLTSLEGCPSEVSGNFYCSYNQLTSLEGCPREVSGNFNCYKNQITNFDHVPDFIGWDFYCSNNPISEVYNLFDTKECLEFFKEYKPIKDNKIYWIRLREIFAELGMEEPDPESLKFENYELIYR